VDNKFFTKNEENLRAKHLEGATEKGGLRQVPHLPSLKSTLLAKVAFSVGCGKNVSG